MEENLMKGLEVYVVGASLLIMIAALVGVMILVYQYRTEKTDANNKNTKVKRTRFRRRSIQFLSVGMALPAIIILALSGKLASEAIATLFGTFFGYVLSGISDEEKDF